MDATKTNKPEDASFNTMVQHVTLLYDQLKDYNKDRGSRQETPIFQVD